MPDINVIDLGEKGTADFEIGLSYVKYTPMIDQELDDKILYDLDQEDMVWLSQHKKEIPELDEDSFECIIDRIEKRQGFDRRFFELRENDQELLNKIPSTMNFRVLKKVYTYWKEKRLRRRDIKLYPDIGKPLLMEFEIATDPDDPDPFLCFRSRIEKKDENRRSRRKNDTEAYLKLLQMRDDLEHLRNLLEAVKQRELLKMEMLKNGIPQLSSDELSSYMYNLVMQRQQQMQQMQQQQLQQQQHYQQQYLGREITANGAYYSGYSASPSSYSSNQRHLRSTSGERAFYDIVTPTVMRGRVIRPTTTTTTASSSSSIPNSLGPLQRRRRHSLHKSSSNTPISNNNSNSRRSTPTPTHRTTTTTTTTAASTSNAMSLPQQKTQKIQTTQQLQLQKHQEQLKIQLQQELQLKNQKQREEAEFLRNHTISLAQFSETVDHVKPIFPFLFKFIDNSINIYSKEGGPKDIKEEEEKEEDRNNFRNKNQLDPEKNLMTSFRFGRGGRLIMERNSKRQLKNLQPITSISHQRIFEENDSEGFQQR